MKLEDITDPDILACVEVLKKQKVSEAKVRLFAAAAVASRTKFVGLFAANFKKLSELAEKNGAKDGDALSAISFGFATKLDMTNVAVLKADYSFTFTESHRTRDGVMEELDQAPLFKQDATGSEVAASGSSASVNEPVPFVAPADPVGGGKKPRKPRAGRDAAAGE